MGIRFLVDRYACLQMFSTSSGKIAGVMAEGYFEFAGPLRIRKLRKRFVMHRYSPLVAHPFVRKNAHEVVDNFMCA